MFNEYVGPTRFQWTPVQLELVNKVLNTLPDAFPHSACSDGLLNCICRPTVEEMIDMEPSETVNSEQIIPLLPKYFKIIEHKKYGGTLLHLLLNHVMANFDTSQPLHATVLKMIFLYEQTMIEHGILDSYFCYVVARALPSAT